MVRLSAPLVYHRIVHVIRSYRWILPSWRLILAKEVICQSSLVSDINNGPWRNCPNLFYGCMLRNLNDEWQASSVVHTIPERAIGFSMPDNQGTSRYHWALRISENHMTPLNSFYRPFLPHWVILCFGLGWGKPCMSGFGGMMDVICFLSRVSF